MRFSQERTNRISKEIASKILEGGLVESKLADENELRLAIVRILADEFRVEEMVDEEVRKILASYSKKIIQGSREWDILYKKHYEEQISKRRRY